METKQIYLKACHAFAATHNGSAPASLWLGAGIAALRLLQLDEAERALAVCLIRLLRLLKLKLVGDDDGSFYMLLIAVLCVLCSCI